MIKCIHISFGYVESSQMAGLNFTCQSGFKTPEEALVSLANGLYEKYIGDCDFGGKKKRAPNKCCSKALAKKFDFCPKCGASLRKQDFDVQEYADWLRNLPRETADSWGGGEIVASALHLDQPSDVWNPWNTLTSLLKLKQSEVLDIIECGEAVLLRATTRLRDEYPDQDLEMDFDELGYLPEEYKKLLPELAAGSKDAHARDAGFSPVEEE
jgi:hypothetical protein